MLINFATVNLRILCSNYLVIQAVNTIGYGEQFKFC
jgi:hypothetical protein